MNLSSSRIATDYKKFVAAIGSAGLAFIAIGLALSKAMQNLGMALVLLGILLSGRAVWRRLFYDPLVWLCLVWIVYIVTSAWMAAAQTPADALSHWDYARKMARLLYIPLVAWWFHADPHRIRLALQLMVLGVLAAILIHMDWTHLLQGLVRSVPLYRNGFGINAQHFGLMCVLALVSLTVFFPQWSGRVDNKSRHWWLLRGLVLIAIAVLILLAALISQARTAWISLALLLGLATLYGVICGLRGRGSSALWLISAVVLTGVFIATYWGTVERRLVPELKIVASYVAEEQVPAEVTSMSVRLRLWEAGIDGIAARPWFGWGPGGEKVLVAMAANDSAPYLAEFSHVHNSFLSLVIRSGLIGFIILSIVAATIGRAAFRGWKVGLLDGRLFTYLSIVFGVFLFVNLTESYLDLQIGWFIIAFFGGAAYSFTLCSKAVKCKGAATEASSEHVGPHCEWINVHPETGS